MRTSPLSKEQLEKTISDLAFIQQVSQHAKSLGYRSVISGGYAVDGALGSITRYHDDIDIQIYGKKSANEAINEILNKIDPNLPGALVDKGRQEYYHYFHLPIYHSLVEFYYLQITTDPFSDKKILIKQDGRSTEPQSYKTKLVTLNGVEYEVQNPVIELTDRIYKREHRGDPKKEKHEQDIENLRSITNKHEVENELNQILNPVRQAQDLSLSKASSE